MLPQPHIYDMKTVKKALAKVSLGVKKFTCERGFLDEAFLVE